MKLLYEKLKAHIAGRQLRVEAFRFESSDLKVSKASHLRITASYLARNSIWIQIKESKGEHLKIDGKFAWLTECNVWDDSHSLELIWEQIVSERNRLSG